MLDKKDRNYICLIPCITLLGGWGSKIYGRTSKMFLSSVTLFNKAVYIISINYKHSGLLGKNNNGGSQYSNAGIFMLVCDWPKEGTLLMFSDPLGFGHCQGMGHWGWKLQVRGKDFHIS